MTTLLDHDKKSWAVLSDDRRYRYRLGRRWGRGPCDVWIMLNPSTADAMRDDRTIHRCRGFSERGGAGGLVVVNLFALRATDPKALLTELDPVGPDNDEHLRVVFDRAHTDGGRIIGAWGAHKLAGRRAREVARIVESVQGQGWLSLPMLTLGLTKAGAPRHPLYVKGDIQPAVWEPI